MGDVRHAVLLPERDWPLARIASVPDTIVRGLRAELAECGTTVINSAVWRFPRDAACRAIRDAGAHLLFLPPYSPDINPIEMMFAKLKTLLRNADEGSIAAVWHCIGSLLNEFSPAKCRNYIRHAG